MFDLSIGKLIVIAGVALIVIGPERLPRAAKAIGVIIGRLQCYMDLIKSELRTQIRVANPTDSSTPGTPIAAAPIKAQSQVGDVLPEVGSSTAEETCMISKAESPSSANRNQSYENNK